MARGFRVAISAGFPEVFLLGMLVLTWSIFGGVLVEAPKIWGGWGRILY